MDTRPVSILVLDDHAETVAVMVRVFKLNGYEAIGATSLAEARRICGARDRDFDLAVVDIGLPDGDGRDFLADLAKHCRTRGIVVSGYGTEEDRAQTIAMGIGTFLVKPVTQAALLEAIRTALNPNQPS